MPIRVYACVCVCVCAHICMKLKNTLDRLCTSPRILLLFSQPCETCEARFVSMARLYYTNALISVWANCVACIARANDTFGIVVVVVSVVGTFSVGCSMFVVV